MAHARSVTAAASNLCLSQPAVSLQLGRLESFLGVRLLERTSRAVELTERGRDFLASAENLLELSHQALTQFSGGDSLIRIGVSQEFARHHLVALLGSINARTGAPISVTVGMTYDLLQDLTSSQLDFIIAKSHASHNNARLLAAEECAWVCASHFLPNFEEPLPLLSLGEHCTYTSIMRDALTAAQMPWRIAFQSNDLSALLAAVNAGLGISVVGRSTIDGDMRELAADDGLAPLTASSCTYLHISQRARVTFGSDVSDAIVQAISDTGMASLPGAIV